ncbi:MAG: class I SAM-dependent methyltransferase, partial [Planctomycetota bacterium]
MTSDRPSATPDYVLGTGDHELERLALQQRVWSDQTEAWIDALGVEPGATVIDAGCGPGWVTESLLERVGPTGRVIAIDESDRWCEHVRSRSER